MLRDTGMLPDRNVLVILCREVDRLAATRVGITIRQRRADVLEDLVSHRAGDDPHLVARRQGRRRVVRTMVGNRRGIVRIPADEVAGHRDADRNADANAVSERGRDGYGADCGVDLRSAVGLDFHRADGGTHNAKRAVLHEGVCLRQDDVRRLRTTTADRHCVRVADRDGHRGRDRIGRDRRVIDGLDADRSAAGGDGAGIRYGCNDLVVDRVVGERHPDRDADGGAAVGSRQRRPHGGGRDRRLVLGQERHFGGRDAAASRLVDSGRPAHHLHLGEVVDRRLDGGRDLVLDDRP